MVPKRHACHVANFFVSGVSVKTQIRFKTFYFNKRCKNEIQDNNEKICCRFSDIFSHKIDVWSSQRPAASVRLKGCSYIYLKKNIKSF